jgi:hypothetical protein
MNAEQSKIIRYILFNLSTEELPESYVSSTLAAC